MPAFVSRALTMVAAERRVRAAPLTCAFASCRISTSRDAPFDPPAAEADVVVLAGDIHNGAAGVEWAKRAFRQPVVYVAGNHEPFDGEFHATAAALRAAARRVRTFRCSIAERP